MNTYNKSTLTTLVVILLIGSSMAGRYHERHRERGILGLGLDLLGVRPAYGYGGGYGHGRPVVATTSYYGYPAYGNSGYGHGGQGGYGSGGYGHGGYGGGYGNGGYINNGGYGGGYGHNGGYGYLDRPGYDGYGYGRSPIRVKTVIKSKHDY